MYVKQIGGVSIVFYDNGFIDNIYNMGFSKDVIIPDVINGIKITGIGNGAIKGKFRKIVMPGGIERVAMGAFYDSQVEEVVWSSGCDSIPNSCFMDSHIKSIRNIDHVSCIGERAFARSCIDEFDWPSCCPEIPLLCFAFSRLKKLHNVSGVSEIKEKAFMQTSLLELDLSYNAAVSIADNAFEDVYQGKILLPYYATP